MSEQGNEPMRELRKGCLEEQACAHEVRLTIDNVPVAVAAGSTLLEAAQHAGVRIPTLCYLKERSAVASCRMCVVEVEGEQHPLPACATVARDGMRVTTHSEKLNAYRKLALELIVSSKGAALASLACDTSADANACTSELSRLCHELEVEEPLEFAQVKEIPLVEGNPFLAYDPNLCIECQRCVGACNSAARNHSLQTRMRGSHVLIDAPFGQNWRETECESCGNCAQACPTGALSLRKRGKGALAEPEGRAGESAHTVRTTCPHCGVGCQLELEVRNGRIVSSKGAFGASNRGLLCVKGRSASFDFVSSPDRLTTPLVRNKETGKLEPSTWDEALSLVTSRFSHLRDEYGGRSIAAFACSRSTNEDVYLFQKMARVALQTNNVDSCARV